MANRTMKRQLGVIEDVLVWVDKFILPADFIILDYKVDYKVPIILGRPFLATGKALCDVEAGELTFWVGNEKVVFHMFKSMRQPNSNVVCSFVNLVTDVIVDDTSATINVGDMLEAILPKFDYDAINGFMEYVNSLQGMGSYNYAPQKLSLDLENRKTPPTKTSIEDPPTLELKPLLPHLRLHFGRGGLCVQMVEALPNNEARSVVAFLKTNIFTRFGNPRAMISDEGSHFCNKAFDTLLSMYGITHKVKNPYHPQASGQVEVSN
ncbi:uncharacterized protein [Nicotiana tomentosiformis]|uniref:uncharacterized protein n=1 Tax=Nicotiana tomentosiformis TaxID=4098 RepID=UPI00388C4086